MPFENIQFEKSVPAHLFPGILAQLWIRVCIFLDTVLSCFCFLKYLNPVKVFKKKKKPWEGRRYQDSREEALLWAQHQIRSRRVNNFTSCWSDGVALCELVQSLVPGSCPRYDLLKPNHGVNNLVLGLKLIQKHLAISPVLTPDQIASAKMDFDAAMRYYISLIREAAETNGQKALEKTHNKKTIKMDKIEEEETDDNFPCTAKGSGLLIGAINKCSKFTISLKQRKNLNIYIEIRGPNDAMAIEKINNTLPRRLSHIMNQHEIEQMNAALYSNILMQTDDSDDDNYVKMNKITLDYQFITETELRVNFMPRSIGRHVVIIKWHAEHIPGSPFIINVTECFEVDPADSSNSSRRSSLQRLSISKDILIDKNTKTKTTKSERNGRVRHVTRRRVLRRVIKREGGDIVLTDVTLGYNMPTIVLEKTISLDNADDDIYPTNLKQTSFKKLDLSQTIPMVQSHLSPESIVSSEVFCSLIPTPSSSNLTKLPVTSKLSQPISSEQSDFVDAKQLTASKYVVPAQDEKFKQNIYKAIENFGNLIAYSIMKEIINYIHNKSYFKNSTNNFKEYMKKKELYVDEDQSQNIYPISSTQTSNVSSNSIQRTNGIEKISYQEADNKEHQLSVESIRKCEKLIKLPIVEKTSIENSIKIQHSVEDRNLRLSQEDNENKDFLVNLSSTEDNIYPTDKLKTKEKNGRELIKITQESRNQKINESEFHENLLNDESHHLKEIKLSKMLACDARLKYKCTRSTLCSSRSLPLLSRSCQAFELSTSDDDIPVDQVKRHIQKSKRYSLPTEHEIMIEQSYNSSNVSQEDTLDESNFPDFLSELSKLSDKENFQDQISETTQIEKIFGPPEDNYYSNGDSNYKKTSKICYKDQSTQVHWLEIKKATKRNFDKALENENKWISLPLSFEKSARKKGKPIPLCNFLRPTGNINGDVKDSPVNVSQFRRSIRLGTRDIFHNQNTNLPLKPFNKKSKGRTCEMGYFSQEDIGTNDITFPKVLMKQKSSPNMKENKIQMNSFIMPNQSQTPLCKRYKYCSFDLHSIPSEMTKGSHTPCDCSIYNQMSDSAKVVSNICEWNFNTTDFNNTTDSSISTEDTEGTVDGALESPIHLYRKLKYLSKKEHQSVSEIHKPKRKIRRPKVNTDYSHFALSPKNKVKVLQQLHSLKNETNARKIPFYDYVDPNLQDICSFNSETNNSDDFPSTDVSDNNESLPRLEIIPDYLSLFMGQDYISFTGLLDSNGMSPIAWDIVNDNFCSVDYEMLTNGEVQNNFPKPERCQAFGSGLNYGQVGIKNNFQVKTADSGNGYITVGIQGPRANTTSETTVVYTGDNLYEIIYEVTQPGYYLITIKWADINIPDSPFICKVTF